MLDYDDTQIPGPAEGIPTGIVQLHSPARVIKDNFTNLSDLYSNPRVVREMERDESCFKPIEYALVAGVTILVACNSYYLLSR